MSIDYFLASDLGGTIPLTGITVDNADPGALVAIPTIFVVKSGGTDASELSLSALMATRRGGDGALSDGWEPVSELWLEAMAETSEWTPVGGGPGGDVLPLALEDFTGAICPVQLRLRVPELPASAGDVAISIEVFFK